MLRNGVGGGDFPKQVVIITLLFLILVTVGDCSQMWGSASPRQNARVGGG